jgi:hypothetical protein
MFSSLQTKHWKHYYEIIFTLVYCSLQWRECVTQNNVVLLHIEKQNIIDDWIVIKVNLIKSNI